jgi:hypothetical protein
MSDLDKLEELAKGVTEPEWKWDDLRIEDDGYIRNPQGSYLGGTMICLTDTYEGSGGDSLFLQTFNAATILRLVRVARAAKLILAHHDEGARPDQIALDELRAALGELK